MNLSDTEPRGVKRMLVGGACNHCRDKNMSIDGHGLWWEQNDKRTSKINPRKSPFSDVDNLVDEVLYDKWNLPMVQPCVCGLHPFPANPVMHMHTRSVDGNEQNDSPYLLSGMPRSGSTAVWQIMTGLKGHASVRSFEFNSVCPLFIRFEKVLCCVRHPFDAYFSALRAFGSMGAMFQPMMELQKFRQLQVFQECMGYRPDMQVHFIKYEDFWDRELEKIKHIATLLEIDCDDQKAQQILDRTSVNKNRERSLTQDQDAKSFAIRKEHVGLLMGRPGQGVELPSQIKKDIVENHPWIFKHFNYSMEI